MADMPNAINIYTDGSWKKGSGGFGFIIYHPDGTEDEHLIPGFQETTINAMELRACIEAVKTLRKNRRKYNSTVYLQNYACIHSDSQYVVDTYKRAVCGDMLKRGAITIEGRDYANVSLWKDLIREIKKSGMRIEIKKVKAHSGIKGNVGADKLATRSRKIANRKDFSRAPNRTRRPLKIKEREIDEIKTRLIFTVYIINTLPRTNMYEAGVQILRPKKYFGVKRKIQGQIKTQTLHIGHIYQLRLRTNKFQHLEIDKIVEDLGRPSDNQDLLNF
jgi:ribonuclease HI